MSTLPYSLQFAPQNIDAGQIAVTTAAQQGPNAPAGHIVLTAASANTAPISIGGAGVTATTGLLLPPGASVTIALQNLNRLYFISTAAGTLSWLTTY